MVDKTFNFLRFIYNCGLVEEYSKQIGRNEAQLNSIDAKLHTTSNNNEIEALCISYNNLSRENLNIELKKNSIEREILEFELRELDSE